MTGHKFAKGDTVRALRSFLRADVDLLGLVGTVTGHTTPGLGAYNLVRFAHGTSAPLLDSELELVTDAAEVPDARLEMAREVVDVLFPWFDAQHAVPEHWPPEVWAVADALLAKGYTKAPQ